MSGAPYKIVDGKIQVAPQVLLPYSEANRLLAGMTTLNVSRPQLLGQPKVPEFVRYKGVRVFVDYLRQTVDHMTSLLAPPYESKPTYPRTKDSVVVDRHTKLPFLDGVELATFASAMQDLDPSGWRTVKLGESRTPVSLYFMDKKPHLFRVDANGRTKHDFLPLAGAVQLMERELTYPMRGFDLLVNGHHLDIHDAQLLLTARAVLRRHSDKQEPVLLDGEKEYELVIVNGIPRFANLGGTEADLDKLHLSLRALGRKKIAIEKAHSGLSQRRWTD